MERVAQVEGISLFMQPVQDLTIETRASRTQYQFTLEIPTRRNSASGLRDWLSDCGNCRNCAM
jgi:hypothetical protein